MRNRFFITGVVLMIFISVLQWGCSRMIPIGDPNEYWQQVLSKMGSINSYHLKMDMVLEYDGPDGAGKMSMKADGEYEDVYTTDRLSHLIVVQSGFGGGASGQPMTNRIDEYIAGGKVYIQSPTDGAWYFMDVPDLASGDMQAIFSPQSTWLVFTAASDLRVTSETNMAIRYEFEIDPGVFSDALNSEFVRKLLAQEMSAEELSLFSETMRNFFVDAIWYMLVDKKSGLATEIGVTVPDALKSMAQLFRNDPPPPGATMRVGMKMYYSDYNKDFGLVLPAAAQDAHPISEMNNNRT